MAIYSCFADTTKKCDKKAADKKDKSPVPRWCPVRDILGQLNQWLFFPSPPLFVLRSGARQNFFGKGVHTFQLVNRATCLGKQLRSVFPVYSSSEATGTMGMRFLKLTGLYSTLRVAWIHSPGCSVCPSCEGPLKNQTDCAWLHKVSFFSSKTSNSPSYPWLSGIKSQSFFTFAASSWRCYFSSLPSRFPIQFCHGAGNEGWDC